jgi:ABC-type sugar transport system ATPase subunit
MIVVERLTVRAGQFSLVEVSFSLPAGRHGILMGRTGSGKTTLLEALCGLKPVVGGSIRLGDVDVTRLKPAARGIGYVPQDGALFPSMTVAEHLGFALTVRRRPGEEIGRRVAELAGLLGIGHLLGRRPQGLSGGEAQRVALGRALGGEPMVLCLDEPLSALDDDTREEMSVTLETIRERTGVTILHVTHSQAEARRLGERLFLLRDGRVVEGDLTSPTRTRRDGGSAAPGAVGAASGSPSSSSSSPGSASR